MCMQQRAWWQPVAGLPHETPGEREAQVIEHKASARNGQARDAKGMARSGRSVLSRLRAVCYETEHCVREDVAAAAEYSPQRCTPSGTTLRPPDSTRPERVCRSTMPQRPAYHAAP